VKSNNHWRRRLSKRKSIQPRKKNNTEEVEVVVDKEREEWDQSLNSANTAKKIEKNKKVTKDSIQIATNEIEKRRNINQGQNHNKSLKDMRAIMSETKRRMFGQK
jgi:hypothetical protein